ncbi:MAG: GldG family protein [Alphaproteobacteria bacterium]|nr:GldG family protein [Alphaproteobacteria bacterium]
MTKSNLSSFKDFFLNPWALICFIAFYAALGLAWLYFGNFWALGFNSLWGMFAFLPWILAVFIPCLLLGMWADNPTVKCSKRFLYAFLFICFLFAASFPIWIAVNYTGPVDNSLIFASYAVSVMLSAIFIGIADCCSYLFKNQILNLILAIAIGIIFAYASGPYFMPLIQGLLLPSAMIYFPAALVLVLFISYLRYSPIKAGRRTVEIISAAVIFLSLNIIVKPLDNYVFADLTKNGLYSLTASSKSAVQTLKAPITIMLKSSPEFAEYTNALRKLLQSYEKAANNNITIKEYPNVSGETISLAIMDDTDKHKEIQNLDGYGSAALENAITSAILEVAGNSKKTIGLISSLPIDGQHENFNPAKNIPRWEVMKQIRERFNVAVISPDEDKIPENIDVLLLINPKNFSESFKQSLDNFIMTKGKMLVFLDPLPEAEKAYPEAALPGAITAHDWFTNLGFKFHGDKIVANPENARKVLKDGKLIDYIVRLCIPKSDFNNNDALMKNLQQINITSSGYFEIIPKDNLVVTPLFTSGVDSGVFALSEILADNNPNTLAKKYTPDDNDYILALRVTGTPESMYKEGVKASNPVDIMLFADSDILYDQFWILPKEGAFADNGDMVLDALENLSGSPSLADLRTKQKQTLDLIMIKDPVTKRNISLLALIPLPGIVVLVWGIFLWQRRFRNDSK